MPNLKSAALTLTKILAFNEQIFTGSRDPCHAPLPSFDIWGLAAAKRRRIGSAVGK